MNNLRIQYSQRGLTLIEVMISMTLGIIFLGAAMTFLVTGQQSSQSQDSGSRIQENARFAMEFIREQVRMAGYTEDFNVSPGYIYRGACGTVNGQTATNCSDEVSATEESQGDRLAISLISPDAEDCLGSDTGSGSTVIANVFWVQVVDNISSLYCQGFDINASTPDFIGTAQPLVDGIEQMQVQYGVDTDADGIADQYMNATAVQAAGDWDNVWSVKVGLLVSAGRENNDSGGVESDLVDVSYQVLDGTYDADIDDDGEPDDNRMKRVYTTLILMNNRS